MSILPTGGSTISIVVWYSAAARQRGHVTVGIDGILNHIENTGDLRQAALNCATDRLHPRAAVADTPGVTRRLRSVTCGLALLILMAATARRSEMSGLPLDVSPSQSTPLSTVELHQLLRRGDIGLLTQRIETARANAARNIADEAALDQLVAAFDSADPSLTEPLDTWVTLVPTSYAARLARAAHRIALARLDGGRTVRTATAATGAQADLSAALAADPRLTTAVALQLAAAPLTGEPFSCDELARPALQRSPASLGIRVALIGCLAAAPDSATARIDRDDMLRSLPGFLDWYRGGHLPAADAIAAYSQALKAGPHWWFYRDRARAWLRTGHAAEALADAGLGLVLFADQPDLLMTRAAALRALNRQAEFEETLRLVRTIDSTNTELAALTAAEWRTTIDAARRLIEPRRPGNEAVATHARLAIAMIDERRGLLPDDADAFYWRGRAHLALEEPDQAFNDFERALALDATHTASYVQTVRLLEARGDWVGVAERWTGYLSVAPGDAAAYRQRASAYRHLDQTAPAVIDESRACALGDNAACHAL